jgi:hypothetical protein
MLPDNSLSIYLYIYTHTHTHIYIYKEEISLYSSTAEFELT